MGWFSRKAWYEEDNLHYADVSPYGDLRRDLEPGQETYIFRNEVQLDFVYILRKQLRVLCDVGSVRMVYEGGTSASIRDSSTLNKKMWMIEAIMSPEDFTIVKGSSEDSSVDIRFVRTPHIQRCESMSLKKLLEDLRVDYKIIDPNLVKKKGKIVTDYQKAIETVLRKPEHAIIKKAIDCVWSNKKSAFYDSYPSEVDDFVQNDTGLTMCWIDMWDMTPRARDYAEYEIASDKIMKFCRQVNQVVKNKEYHFGYMAGGDWDDIDLGIARRPEEEMQILVGSNANFGSNGVFTKENKILVNGKSVLPQSLIYRR